MIKKNIYGMMAAGVLVAGTLTSCQQEVEPVLSGGGEALPVVVSAAMEGADTRASGNSWENMYYKKIGVYAYDGLTKKYTNRNFEYDGINSTPTSSIFTCAADNEIYFNNNNEWTFHAYYPYSGGTDANIAIDCAIQCAAPTIDFMFASGAKAKHNQNYEAANGYYYGDSTNPVISFDGAEGHGTKFKHVMCRMIIRVHVGAGIDDEDVSGGSCLLSGLLLKGNFAREDDGTHKAGTIWFTDLSRPDLQLVENGVGTGWVSYDSKRDDFFRLSTLYLMPQQLGVNGLRFGLKLKGESDYQYCKVMGMERLEGGKSYVLDVNVSKGNSIYMSDCQITNWTYGNTVTGNLE